MSEYEELEAVIEEPFRRIEAQTAQLAEARMERLSRILDDLERELDEFLAQADHTTVPH